MSRDFNKWLNTMRMSINRYDYYVDFQKVYKNTNEIKVELNILNSLIGSADIADDFRTLLKTYPNIIRVMPILLAKRESEIYCQDEKGGFLYDFAYDANQKMDNEVIERYVYFMDKTGLFELLEKHIINNLVDYVMGVETGLDSNGRKNRGGHQMEDLVEEYIKKARIEYYKEMYLHDIEKKWGVDLSAISAQGTTTKRWDFVVKTSEKVFLIETNFYSSGGSKLNETARSYKMIAEETENIDGVDFMWITDGGGWRLAKRNLQETFNAMEYLYNIADLERGTFNELFLGNGMEGYSATYNTYVVAENKSEYSSKEK